MTTPPTGPQGPNEQYPGNQPQGGAFPPPAGAYPPPAGSYPPPSGSHPAPEGAYTPPPGAYDFNQPQGGFPPAGAGFPTPAPPIPPRRKIKWWMIVVPLVVILAVGGYIYSQKTDTKNAAVGDCIQVKTASATNADTNQIDCNDVNAVYLVTATGGSGLTCDPIETEYTESTSSDKVETKLCLRENAKVGDCIEFPTLSTGTLVKVACDTAPNKDQTGKVTVVDLTTGDESKCPKDSLYASAYETRKILICYGPVS